eukprot:COSAG01_NODE_3587_length_5905_cov_36.428522_5_plen_141_part_00
MLPGCSVRRGAGARRLLAGCLWWLVAGGVTAAAAGCDAWLAATGVAAADRGARWGMMAGVKASVPLERHGSCVSLEGLEDSVESPSDDPVTATDPFFLVPDSTTDATQQPESQPEGGVRAGGEEGEKVGVARARQRSSFG